MTGQVVRRTMDLAGTGVPVIDITGAADGPQLTVISGVHGCEYASMAGVRRWAAALDPAQLRGRVRVVPVLNITGFRARAPFVVPEDGKNLNRCFPGNPDGTLAERLAHAAFTEFIQGADGLVDAHCGDMVEALEPFAMYEAGPAEGKAKALAEAYGLGYVMRQEPGPDRAVGGTTSAAAAQIGVAAITAEAGGCGLVEEDMVALHVRGLGRVLTEMGMADPGANGAPASGAGAAGEPGPAEYLGRFLWLRCAQEGWWEPSVAAGENVAEGQTLGWVHSIDGGQALQEITSPADGVMIFLTSSPAVAADGLLLGLGAA
jgi:predicted deacylase